jgi:hypothetical protein
VLIRNQRGWKSWSWFFEITPCSCVSDHVAWFNRKRESLRHCLGDRQQGMSAKVRRTQGIPLVEIARVLVRFDHVVWFTVNANDGIVWPAEMLRVINGVIRLGVPQPTERQRIGD